MSACSSSASADCISSSSIRAAAVKRSLENSRPITAAICATLRLGATRSSRSISASLSVSGTLSGAGCSVRPDVSCKGALKVLLVSSSMYSGTPSAFSIIWSTNCCGMLPPFSRSRIIAFTSVCDNRVSECVVMFACASHAGRNSGRHDIMSNTRAWPIRLMTSSSSSSVEASSQCASSKTQSVGRCKEKARRTSTSVLIVLFFICCAVSSDSSRLVSVEMDNNLAISRSGSLEPLFDCGRYA